MAVAIVIVIVMAALLVIASGVWVAIGLIAAIATPKPGLPAVRDDADTNADLDNLS